MKCTNGHDLADGQTHCTECGVAATGLIAKAVCACGVEGLAAHKFCAGCGEPMVKAVAVTQDELDKGLDALGLIAKANAALTDDIASGKGKDPDDPDGDGDGDEDVQLLKAEMLKPGEDGTIDALPILDLILKANNRVASIVQAHGREMRAMRKDLGIIAKSEEVVGRGQFANARGLEEKIEALDATFANWAGLPKPRKAQVELIRKAVQTGDADKDDSLAGNALIAKAVSLENQGLLQDGDASRVNHFANRGVTLDGIKTTRPDLHARLVAAIGTQQQHGQ